MSGAIDKLEIQAPGRDFWTDQVLRACTRPDPASDVLLRRQGGQYAAAVDLRRYGCSSILYRNSRARGTDKLVLVGVGGMSLSQIETEISYAFKGDIDDLKFMRIDIAVDVLGYSVEWFRSNCYVTRKRCGREIGKRIDSTFQNGVQTLMLGKRPNVFRFYDKNRQLRAEAKQSRHQCQSEGTLPLTRAERQYGSSKIPEQLASLKSLRDGALTINPFEPLEFPDLLKPSNDFIGLSVGRYLKARGLVDLIRTCGYQRALAELNLRTGGKGRKVIADIERFMVKDQDSVTPDLHAMYRESLSRQLGFHSEAA